MVLGAAWDEFIEREEQKGPGRAGDAWLGTEGRKAQEWAEQLPTRVPTLPGAFAVL